MAKKTKKTQKAVSRKASKSKEKKVVLAYSGGLDTSIILTWLRKQGYNVVTFTANLGQPGENMEAIRKKALTCGASKAYVEDLRKEFVTDFIFPVIRAGATYENRYLMGTSVARPLIAKKQVEVAQKERADFVAHGATGKGNDQVRFEMTAMALNPAIKIISPWKDPSFLKQFQGRPDMIKFARRNKIPIKATIGKPWSEDANLMHISYEAGELEDPKRRPREEMFTLTVSPKNAPDNETELEIEFKEGNAIRVYNRTSNIEKRDPLELYIYLNQIGGRNGVGRVDMVENRYVGIKSRGVYESPAATILHAAHRDLEGITMDREVMHLRDSLIPKFAELVYYGYWFSPEMAVLRTFFDATQKYVTGKVYLRLYKGNIIIDGRESPVSLYDPALSSMDVHGGYDQTDSKGFIRINAWRLKINSLREAKARRMAS